MEIKKEVIKGIVLLKIDGKLDSVSAPVAGEKIGELITTGEKKIVIDLEKISYISSAGLRTFLVGAKNIKEKKGEIVFCSVSESVKKVFEISGFNTIVKVVDTKDEALKCFA